MTIKEFISELQSLSEENKELTVVIKAPNGMIFEPTIKFLWKDDNFLLGERESVIITYED